MKSVLFGKKGHVGIITLNSPEDRNALSLELMDEIIILCKMIIMKDDNHILLLSSFLI